MSLEEVLLNMLRVNEREFNYIMLTVLLLSMHKELSVKILGLISRKMKINALYCKEKEICPLLAKNEP